MSESGAKRVQDYVDEYRRLGERFASRYGHAALLRREDDVVEEDDPSFHTSFMRRDMLDLAASTPSSPPPPLSTIPPPGDASTRPSDRPRPHQVGEVFPVAKRPGSAFPDRVGVGRARNVDVCLLLPKVSKYHAFFARDAEGQLTLTDAGSKNGTFVDGVALAEKVATPIRDGAELCFGPYRFAFYSEAGFVSLIARRAALR